MDRTRRFLLSGTIILALAGCNTPGTTGRNSRENNSAGPAQPNIIYIYADDLGYGELGCYGQEKIKTPNLDRLAAEGIRFTQHYTSIPVCAPARCMLLTGRHGGHSYIRGNYEMGGFADNEEGGQMPLPEGTYTLGHLMQEAGYVTGAIGKWGLGMETTTGAPNKQGFDYFYGYLDQKQAHNYYPTHLWENGKWDTLRNDYFLPHAKLSPEEATAADFEKFIGKDYSPDKMTEKAEAFIRKNKARPFFLYLPYTIPHVSLQIPPESEAYKMYEGNWDTVAYYGQMGYTPHPRPLAAYAAMITQLDAYVGRVMALISELGLDENTMILFSSDNGPTFNGGTRSEFFNSTGGLRGQKMDIYEGGIREPFLARWPGHIPAGTVSDHVSVQYDIMATFADLLDVEAPANDGISLLPTLLGESGQKSHDFLYFEYHARGGQLAVRTGDWKGVKTNLLKDPQVKWELYNLAEDVKESRDVAARHPDILARLDSIVRREHRPAHIREWEFIDPRFSK